MDIRNIFLAITHTTTDIRETIDTSTNIRHLQHLLHHDLLWKLFKMLKIIESLVRPLILITETSV